MSLVGSLPGVQAVVDLDHVTVTVTVMLLPLPLLQRWLVSYMSQTTRMTLELSLLTLFYQHTLVTAAAAADVGACATAEMVGLIREPENAYDANAIRVENIAAEKVGHLNRQLAAQVGMVTIRYLLRLECGKKGGGLRDDGVNSQRGGVGCHCDHS